MSIQKTPYQKTYKLQTGSQEFTVDFKGCERQFHWLGISLICGKSDKHLTIYDSCNVECVAKNDKKCRTRKHFRCLQRYKHDEI